MDIDNTFGSKVASTDNVIFGFQFLVVSNMIISNHGYFT